MKYFKDVNNNVYAYKLDGSQDEYIDTNLTLMTQKESDSHLNPPTTKASKLAELEMLYTESMKSLTVGYSDVEQMTWETQYQQATKFMLDNTAITPALDALVTSKGTTKDIIAPIIIAKAEAIKVESLRLTGKYQSLVDSVNALPITATQSDFDAIIW